MKWRLSKRTFMVLIAILAVLFSISLIMGTFMSRTVAQIDYYQLKTFIANEETLLSTTEGEETEIEGGYLSFGVLNYPGEIVEGSSIMNDCLMAIYNPGPEDLELGVSYFTWSLGNYYSGAGYYDLGTLKVEDAQTMNCYDVFGASQQMYSEVLGEYANKVVIPVPSNRFILPNIPLVVTLHTDEGDFKWEGSVDYIPKRALV